MIEAIVNACAKHFHVQADAVLSPSRSATATRARAWSMWVARNQWGWSYPEIGREMGRDHTTVIAAVSRVEREIATDAGQLTRDALVAALSSKENE